MSGEFGESLALLANLEFGQCKSCAKNIEKLNLKRGLCPTCQIDVSKKAKKSSLVAGDLKKPIKAKKKQQTSTRYEFEKIILRQQNLIEKLTNENIELISQINVLLGSIENLQNKPTDFVDNRNVLEISRIDGGTEKKEKFKEKIVLSYYNFQLKKFQYYSINEITDQILLETIQKIESNLNSAGQLKAIQIIGSNYLNGGKITSLHEVDSYIRDNSTSFNKTFLLLENSKILKLGKKALHCELIEKTYNNLFTPSYSLTELGKRYFKIWAEYFKKDEVIKRTKTNFKNNLYESRGIKLYEIIHSHYNEKQEPVTRQELFNSYKLRKYDIDSFKSRLIKLGLIQKVPIKSVNRYDKEKRIPKYEVAFQPRFAELDLKSLDISDTFFK